MSLEIINNTNIANDIINQINWSFLEEETYENLDPSFDLCGKLNGEYVDVCKNYHGKWLVRFSGILVKSNFNTRTEAKDWAESTNLIKALVAVSNNY